MATYSELHILSENKSLIQKVNIAVAIAAEEIRTEDPGTANHAERVIWAKRALANVDGTARQLMWILLAQNKDATSTNIENATDAQIQTAVNTAIDLVK